MMIEANHKIGEQFNIHFVWQLPDNGDYIRAIFKATVMTLNHEADKYIVQLVDFVAGRQESSAGEPRTQEAFDLAYWQLVLQKVGRKVEVAYESEDGRPLRMRLSTLTEEHAFFRRFENEDEVTDAS